MARDVIALCKMFSGSYLDSNLGHEVINLYQCDNGNHYIYLTDDGKFDQKWINRIKTVLFVQESSTNQLKVIGKADISNDIYYPQQATKNQIDYIVNNGVKYGGTFIHAIHWGDKQQSTWLTFLAEKVYEINGTEVIISFGGNKGKRTKNIHIVVDLDATKVRSSLRQYFEPGAEGCNEQDNDYKNLDKLINDKSIWTESNKKINPKKEDPETRRIIMDELFKERINNNKFLNDYFE